VSAYLDALLDAERLADITRNEIAAGIPPAPRVELDDAFFARSDLAMLALEQADGYGRTLVARGLDQQVDANRRNPLLRGAY
jgi:hypothetical protein